MLKAPMALHGAIYSNAAAERKKVVAQRPAILGGMHEEGGVELGKGGMREKMDGGGGVCMKRKRRDWVEEDG